MLLLCDFKVIAIFFVKDNGYISKNSSYFCYLFNICTEHNRLILYLDLECILFMQCYAGILKYQYLNLSFFFTVLLFTYSVPVSLLSSVCILLNSKSYFHTYYTFRPFIPDFFKHLRNSGSSVSCHQVAVCAPPFSYLSE